MTSDRDVRPRLSIEITIEQRRALDELLGGIHGMQKAVFSIIIDDLIDVLSNPEMGRKFLAAIVARHAKLTDWVKVSIDDDEAD